MANNPFIPVWSTLFLISGVCICGVLAADDPSEVKFFPLDDEYRIYRRKVTWAFALEFCSKCVGSFATFSTPEDSKKVQALIYSKSIDPDKADPSQPDELRLDRRYWVGLSDKHKNAVEGKFRWYMKVSGDGSEMVQWKKFRWYPGQPDHLRSGNRPEHCVGFWNPVYHLDTVKKGDDKGRKEEHSYNDFPCENKYFFICKDTKNPDKADDEMCKKWSESESTAGGSGAAPPPSDDKKSDAEKEMEKKYANADLESILNDDITTEKPAKRSDMEGEPETVEEEQEEKRSDREQEPETAEEKKDKRSVRKREPEKKLKRMDRGREPEKKDKRSDRERESKKKAKREFLEKEKAKRNEKKAKRSKGAVDISENLVK